MTDLLLSLALGVGAIFLANLALVRFARTSAKQAAATVALITLGFYVPYGILRWPGGDVFALYLAVYLLTSLVCGMLLGARARPGIALGAGADRGIFHRGGGAGRGVRCGRRTRVASGVRALAVAHSG